MQIGPKLRSKSLKKLASGAKHVVSTNVRGLGRTNEQLLKLAGPALDFIPGVGPLVHAGLNASASVMAGHNLKHTVGEAAKGAAGGLLKMGLSKIPGVSELASHIPGMGDGLPSGPSTPFAGLDIGEGIGSGISDVANATLGSASAGGQGIVGSLGGALGGGLQKLGGYAMQHPDQLLAGANGVMGALEAKKAGQLERDALNRSRAAYDAKGGIRDSANAGVQRALTQMPDLSSTYAQYSPTLMNGLRKVS